MKQPPLILIALFFTVSLLGQSNQAFPPIPAMRQLHHEYILESLKKIDAFYITSNSIENPNKVIADSIVQSIRMGIEIDTLISQNDKYKWLRSCNELLTSFIDAFQMSPSKLNTTV